jgi:hypothetical protein
MGIPRFLLSAVAQAVQGLSGPIAAQTYDFTSGVPSGWTFSRTGSALALQGGAFAAVPANEPRIESWGGVSRGVAVDGVTTNRIQWGSNAQNVGVSGITKTVESAQTLPDGTVGDVAQFTESTANEQHLWAWGVMDATAGPNTFWVVWRNVGSVQRSMVLSPNDAFFAAFRPDLGAYDYADSHEAVINTGRIQLADGWMLSWLTFDLGSAPGYIRAYLRPTGTSSGGGHQGTTDAAIQIWHTQMVSGARLGQRIATTNVPVASPAEAMSLASLGSISATSGTFVIEHDATDAGTTVLNLGAGSITVPAQSAQTGYQTQRLAVAYNVSGTRIVSNGGAQTTGPALAFGSGLSVGSGLRIQRIRWYASELTESQMWELTRPPITGPSGTANALRVASVRAQLPYDKRGPCGARTNVLVRFADVVGSGARRNLRATFANWGMTSSGETDNSNSVTIAEAALRINGVTAPLTFGGAASVTMAPGAVDVKSDPILPAAFGLSTFDVGIGVEQRVRYVLPDGSSHIMCGQFDREGDPNILGVHTFDPSATSVVNGVAGSGAFSFSGAAPVNDVYGLTRAPVAALVGEFADGAGDPKTFFITGASVLEPSRSYINQALELAADGPLAGLKLAVGGVNTLNFYVPSSSRWTQYLKYARVGVVELGVNDADAQQWHLPIIDLYRSAPSIAHVAACKHLPICGSSDNWATAGGMQRASGSGLYQMRLRRLTKTRALNSGYYDSIISTDAGVQQTPFDDELWYANGTPQFMTDDGGHPTLSGHTWLAPSVADQLDEIEIPA